LDKLFVKTNTSEYPIYIKNNFDELINAFKETNLLGRKICIIADTNTDKLYLNTLKKLLSENFSFVCSYTFKDGEKSKNLDTIIQFYKFFVENKLDRKSIVVALGGGVVGDMAGFAASSYMRGIVFVQIPTTLLAQVDSSVGGKVGVDFMGNKNMIGAFYQPAFVYINTKTLNTLPYDQFAAGMAEAIKYGYIIDSNYIEMIEKNKEEIKKLNSKLLQELIYKSCKSKAYVVSKDEKENGLRAILNFGHTFGHSIESLSKFTLLHGQCVSIGMIAGLYLSAKKGKIKMSEVERLINLLSYFDLPIKAENIKRDDIFKQMFFDKKNKNNKITLVLIEKIGKAYVDNNVSDEEIYSAIDQII